MVLSRKVELEDGLLRAIADDPEGAELSGPRAAALRFMVEFTRRSWELGAGDVAAARESGVADADIVDWVQMGATQTLAVNQADGGGIFFPEEGSDAVGHDRRFYAAAKQGLTGAVPEEAAAPARAGAATSLGGDAVAWVETDLESAEYRAIALRAESRWKVVPNLLRALSRGRSPSLLPFQQCALELLERPQSTALSVRQHAIVRALTAATSRAAYCEATIRRQLELGGESADAFELAQLDATKLARDARDRHVFEFAEKAALHVYRTTKADAQRFRDAGLGDEAYLDVLGTVGLQLGVDRIANALGVPPDDSVLITVDLPRGGPR